MPTVNIKTFGGIAPKIPSRYLNDAQAQVALNCPTFNGSLQPLLALGAPLLTLPKSGTPQTIYRFGQDLVSDTQWWFHWDKDVDVARGQIAGDTSEWTFYTGDGTPKATYAAIATAGSEYPAASRELGIDPPTTAVSASFSGTPTAPITTAAEATLTPTTLAYFGPPDLGTLEISTTTADGAYTQINPGSSDPQVVADAINASAAAVTATVDAAFGTVSITSNSAGADASVHVRYTVAGQVDPTSSLTLAASPNYEAYGTADTTNLRIILEDAEIGSVSSGDVIVVTTETSTTTVAATGTVTATGYASWINTNFSGKVAAQAYGSCVVITPGTEGATSIQYVRESPAGAAVTTEFVETSQAPAPAELLLTKEDVVAAAGGVMKLILSATDPEASVPPEGQNRGVFELDKFEAQGVGVEYYGASQPFALVKTDTVGSNAYLQYRVGSYGAASATISTAGTTSQVTPVTETRVYTYTWVSEEAGLTMESAPAPASSSVDVDMGNAPAVTLTGFDSVPTGENNITARRVYRSTNGVYLFVDEIDAALASYTDSVKPEALGEEMPSLYWAKPPENMKGLINLPNGMMAGFVGRDVYFCEPYRPYAWPEPYMQTVDYPVVGLGRMDTTLAVLTTGVPYFMQGSHPDSVAVVKSDIEQACVSKRSIADAAGGVIYAAPDGLIFLSPGGSRNLTEGLFDYKFWQEYFAPESIHAYTHDNQYIAFYDNGVTQGGFILDVPSGQFTLHDLYATAGYQDRQRDKLFLAEADKELRVWNSGGVLDYRWRSKKFTMPEPMSFSCAQIEAEAYPVTMRVYLDAALLYEKSVTSRDPFRLPSKVGRDWEIEVAGNVEVFSAGLSTSMTEFAGG